MRIEFCIGSLCLAAFACGGTSEGSNWGPGASNGGTNTAPGSATPPAGASQGFGNFAAPDSGTALAEDAGIPAMLTVTVRDFKFWDMTDAGVTNPDFQNAIGAEKGIVAATLGADGTPVYAANAATSLTTHGAMWFNQWYHDTPGFNITQTIPLPLSAGPNGTYGYDSRVSGVRLGLGAAPDTLEWFPIDDGTPHATAFGNQGEMHNYSFTTELHTVFAYGGGETFSFSGDDDVYVFINKTLVIDLGGVHEREVGTVALDTLGLTKGSQYPLDVFNAERRMIESNFSFTTTIKLQAAAQ
jgi:fibro-slime domain-containing protein